MTSQYFGMMPSLYAWDDVIAYTVDDVLAGGWSDPLSGMDAAVDPDARPVVHSCFTYLKVCGHSR